MSSDSNWFMWFRAIEWTPEAVTAAATVVLAFLTFILAFGSVCLWLATRRLVRGAEDTAERQLRAYVLSKEAKNLGPHLAPTTSSFISKLETADRPPPMRCANGSQPKFCRIL